MAKKNDTPAQAATTAPLAGAVNALDDLDDDAIAKGIDEGQRTTGGFEGPSWVPTLHPMWNPTIKETALVEKVEKSGKGSTTRQSIMGKVQAAYAWGRRLYFVDVTAKDRSVIRVKLPEIKSLYAGLNLISLGAIVAIKYDGVGKPSKPGRKPPHRFTASSVDKPALATARADSLVALSMDERDQARALRELAEQPAGAPRMPGDDGANDDPDAHGDAH